MLAQLATTALVGLVADPVDVEANSSRGLPAVIVMGLGHNATAGLTRTPSIDGFTDAFTVFTVVVAVAAVLSLRLVPSGRPQTTSVPHAH